MYKRIGLTLFLFLLVVAGNAQNKKACLIPFTMKGRTIMNICRTDGINGMIRNISRNWSTCRLY